MRSHDDNAGACDIAGSFFSGSRVAIKQGRSRVVELSTTQTSIGIKISIIAYSISALWRYSLEMDFLYRLKQLTTTGVRAKVLIIMRPST